MDGSRFDSLTRALADRPSRRRVLRSLGAGLAAAVGLAAHGTTEAAKGGGKPQGRCLEGYTNCRGTCVDLTDNRNHCGICNLQCSDGEDCCGGACLATCPGDTIRDWTTCGCTCPAAAPNLCPSTDSCLSACPSGKVFDATTCTCVCIETTCCACTRADGAGFCSATFTNGEDCANTCLEGAQIGDHAEFGGIPGTAWVCSEFGDDCIQTCFP